MDDRRLKASVLLAGLAVGGLTLVAWTQEWISVRLATGEAAAERISVGGDVAAGGLIGLGLAGLALVGALSIAGPVFRVILGVLQVAIGATVVVSAVAAIAAPIRASRPAVTEATGVAGGTSVAELVRSASVGPWAYVALAMGVLACLLGIVIVATVRRWPEGTRKYRAVRFEAAERPGSPEPIRTPDAVADWDALSDGADPTSR